MDNMIGPIYRLACALANFLNKIVAADVLGRYRRKLDKVYGLHMGYIQTIRTTLGRYPPIPELSDCLPYSGYDGVTKLLVSFTM